MRRGIDIEGFLAGASLVIFALALGHVMYFKVPADNEKYAMLLLGALIGVVKDCFARYFSSTKGGQEQREALGAMAKASADTAAVAKAAIQPGVIEGSNADVEKKDV